MKNFTRQLLGKENLMVIGFALSPELLRQYKLKDTDKKAA